MLWPSARYPQLVMLASPLSCGWTGNARHRTPQSIPYFQSLALQITPQTSMTPSASARTASLSRTPALARDSTTLSPAASDTLSFAAIVCMRLYVRWSFGARFCFRAKVICGTLRSPVSAKRMRCRAGLIVYRFGAGFQLDFGLL